MRKARHALVLLSAAGIIAADPSRAGISRAPGSSTVGPAFGNTILMVYPDHRVGELWLQADGSYAGEGRRADRTAGHWTVKAGKLCLKQTRPFPAPFSFCTPLPASYRGSWTAKAFTGETIRVSIVPGHVQKPAALALAKSG